MNPHFENLFGITGNRVASTVLELVRDAMVDRALTTAFDCGDLQVVMMTISREPEVRLELEISVVPFQSAGSGAYGAVMLFRDITRMREVEEMRKDFVANVSHELRTPLSILRGYIETVLDDPAIPTDELRRILQVMERHSKRLGLLVEDLLTLAQMESATPNLQLADIKVDDLITSVTRDWEKKLTKKNLKTQVQVDPGLPTIHADEQRLHEVLYNLLDNAMKYSRDGDQVRLSAEQGDGEVVISVADTGIGIAREDLPRIFERFYRTDRARSRELGGTGLGLAIVKHIVQLHQGRVEAESELGKGTTIRVVLPSTGR
jgi:two-component system phosphate regulon sensor histidine kinase PhoR